MSTVGINEQGSKDMERAKWEQLVALTIKSDELGYATTNDRFMVCFIAGYTPARDSVNTPQQAAHWALELTRDEGCSGTRWVVFDRETGEVHRFEQGDIEDAEADVCINCGTAISQDNDGTWSHDEECPPDTLCFSGSEGATPAHR